jgi:hypothetical protein
MGQGGRKRGPTIAQCKTHFRTHRQPTLHTTTPSSRPLLTSRLLAARARLSTEGRGHPTRGASESPANGTTRIPDRTTGPLLLSAAPHRAGDTDDTRCP